MSKKCSDLEIGVKGHSRSSEPTYRSVTYDFLLTILSNHDEPISYRFRDKWRFQSKISNVSHPRVFRAPVDGVPIGIGYRRRSQKTRMMGLPDSQKSFNMFSRFDTILACDEHPASHFLTAKTALTRCVARVKIGRHYAVVLGLYVCVYTL